MSTGAEYSYRIRVWLDLRVQHDCGADFFKVLRLSGGNRNVFGDPKPACVIP